MAPNRWFILALLFLARTAMGLQFQTVGSIGPILVDALAVEYAAIGTLIGLYLLPGVFIALPGGIVGGRFGAKRVVTTSQFSSAARVTTSLSTLGCNRGLSAQIRNTHSAGNRARHI